MPDLVKEHGVNPRIIYNHLSHSGLLLQQSENPDYPDLENHYINNYTPVVLLIY